MTVIITTGAHEYECRTECGKLIARHRYIDELKRLVTERIERIEKEKDVKVTLEFRELRNEATDDCH